MRNGESLKNNADADIFQTAICAVDVTNQPLSRTKFEILSAIPST